MLIENVGLDTLSMFCGWLLW